MLLSSLYIMWSMHRQSLQLLRLTVYEEMHFQEIWQTDGRADRRGTDFDKKSINPFILLLDIHLIISVYGQNASTDRTFFHSKTPKYFLLQTIFLFYM